jgi:glycosyltransferase involved in cell wall biosynthesis
MKKCILIISDTSRNQINGVAITYKSIEKYALDDGYELQYLDASSFNHIDCIGYPELKLSLPWDIDGKIRRIKPDYIHIATEGILGASATVILKLRGIKYTTSYHTNYSEFLKRLYNVPSAVTYGYVRWFHNNAESTLTNTDSMVAELNNNGIVNNLMSWSRGADNPTFTPEQVFVHNKKDPIILYVGRISPEKGLDDLCKLENEFTIHIVGSGPYQAVLEKLYPKVKFIGYKSGKELSDCYNQADVFCFPSQSDTFGIVNIEALIHGTPVAAYPVTGPIDIVEQGVTGYLSWDLSEAIKQCLNLDRNVIREASKIWTWKRCWEIFRESLVPAGDIGILSFNIKTENTYNKLRNIIPNKLAKFF